MDEQYMYIVHTTCDMITVLKLSINHHTCTMARWASAASVTDPTHHCVLLCPQDRGSSACHFAPCQARWAHLDPCLPGQANFSKASGSAAQITKRHLTLGASVYWPPPLRSSWRKATGPGRCTAITVQRFDCLLHCIEPAIASGAHVHDKRNE